MPRSPGEMADDKKYDIPYNDTAINAGGIYDMKEASVVDQHFHGDDVALKYATTAPRAPVPREIDRRITLKADLMLASFLALVYGLNFADKVLNSAGAQLGLRADLDMQNGGKYPYSWQGSAFYLGLLVAEIPLAFLLQVFPVAKTLGLFIVGWGIVVACTAAVSTYIQFIALRTLLGILEASVVPGLASITTAWYTKSQHFSRTNMWFMANGAATIMVNSVAYGLLDRLDKHGLAIAGWKIMMIIFGGLTFLTGIAFYFHIPDNPSEAWFLTEEERGWQVERIRVNNQGYGSRHLKAYQIREALLDPLLWVYCIAVFCNNVANGTVTTFSNQIIAGLGYDTKQGLLMTLPTGGTEFGGCFVISLASIFWLRDHRMVYACSCSAISLVSLCMLAWAPPLRAQLAGLYIWYWASPVSYAALISCVTSNCVGFTKKSFTMGAIMVAFAVGNLVGPQTMLDSEAPQYGTGKAVMAALSAVQFGLMLLILVVYVVRNRRRNRRDEKLPPEIEVPEFADLTDLENPEFRYSY